MADENPTQNPNLNSSSVTDHQALEHKRLAAIWDAIKRGLPEESVDPLINEGLQDPEISERVKKHDLNFEEFYAEIKTEPSKVWGAVTSELSALEQTEFALAEAGKKYDSTIGEKPSSIETIGLEGCILAPAILLVIFAVTVAVVKVLRSSWKGAFNLLFTDYRLWSGAGILVVSVLIGFYVWLRRRSNAKNARRKLEIDEWENRKAELDNTNPLKSPEDAVIGAKAALVTALLQKIIKDKLRELINSQTEPSFETRLRISKAKGLAEVFNKEMAIDTSARDKLKFMLENMPGGSIGIAGPRGAGKTTLLKLYCGPQRILTNLQGKAVLAVLVSAPVAYQARDFILYLFSTICRSALDAERVPQTRPELQQPKEVSELNLAPFLNLIGPLRRVSIYVGTVLTVLSLLIAVLLTFASPPRNEKEERANDTAAASVQPSQVADPLASPAQTASPQQSPSPVANPSASPAQTASPQQSPSPVTPNLTGGQFLGNFVKVMDVKPGDMFLWGLLLIGFGLLCAALLGEQPLPTLATSWAMMLSVVTPFIPFIRELAGATDKPEAKLAEQKKEPEDKEPETQSELARQAADWLKRIKFQQSYTSGWSGALKLPVGLEGGVNNAVTLAENQLSLPEISNFFTQFVELASVTYQVIIGIDELDKLGNDVNAAHAFLNDIKSIFGLEKCFYLVSVSENAMSNFERRGLPFRDVFDSAFDDIIYVDYLNFESAKSLLEKKVLGRPIPFFGLSYVLSGGLARDLIRNFRAVMEFRQSPANPNDLESICKAIIQADLKSKVRATGLSAKQVDLEAEVDAFLEKLYQLENKLQTEDSMYDASLPLLDRGPSNQDPDLDKENQPKIERLDEIGEELATYVYYASTVLEHFKNDLSKDALTNPAPGGALDDLARARQVLAVNPNITRSVLNTFRETYNRKSRASPKKKTAAHNRGKQENMPPGTTAPVI